MKYLFVAYLYDMIFNTGGLAQMVERTLNMFQVSSLMPTSSKMYSILLIKNIFITFPPISKNYINYKRYFTF